MEEKKNKIGKIVGLLIIIVIVISSIIAYSRYFGTTGLEIIETPVVHNDLPTSFNGFKVVTFSDIHYGRTTTTKDVEKIVKKINKLRPDVVIFLGDLFDEDVKIDNKSVDDLKKILNKISASISKYAIKGDNDYSNQKYYDTIFKYANFDILENSNDLIYYKGNTPIKIIGTTSLLKSKIDFDSAFKNEDENEYFTILLSHEPNTINEIKDKKVNIMFTAHSLGGLINVPFVDGVMKYKGSDNYLKGEYKVNSTLMYVNSGIGTYKYDFRWFNRPSINLYRLYNN